MHMVTKARTDRLARNIPEKCASCRGKGVLPVAEDQGDSDKWEDAPGTQTGGLGP